MFASVMVRLALYRRKRNRRRRATHLHKRMGDVKVIGRHSRRLAGDGYEYTSLMEVIKAVREVK